MKNSQPEEEAEDREGADTGSAAGHGGEDAAKEAADDQHDGFPEAEVLDRVKGSPLVLPAGTIHFCNFYTRQ